MMIVGEYDILPRPPNNQGVQLTLKLFSPEAVAKIAFADQIIFNDLAWCTFGENFAFKDDINAVA